VRRLGVVVIEPAAQLCEDRLGIPQLGTADVVALEGSDEDSERGKRDEWLDHAAESLRTARCVSLRS
jgi:hypothetical protein